MNGTSPVLSAQPPAFGDAEHKIEAFGLTEFKPRFEEENPDLRVLSSAKFAPEPKTASFTDPEVISLWFDAFAGAEPAVEFAAFVKGVVTTAHIVSEEDREKLRVAIERLAYAVANENASLPALSTAFQERVINCVEAIFSNNEPISWRPLLAFLHGAFWVLGFLALPQSKEIIVRVNGKREKFSPVAWTQALVERYANLGHLPQ